MLTLDVRIVISCTTAICWLTSNLFMTDFIKKDKSHYPYELIIWIISLIALKVISPHIAFVLLAIGVSIIQMLISYRYITKKK